MVNHFRLFENLKHTNNVALDWTVFQIPMTLAITLVVLNCCWDFQWDCENDEKFELDDPIHISRLGTSQVAHIRLHHGNASRWTNNAAERISSLRVKQQIILDSYCNSYHKKCKRRIIQCSARTHTHTHTHTHTQTRAHAHTYAHTHESIHAYARVA